MAGIRQAGAGVSGGRPATADYLVSTSNLVKNYGPKAGLHGVNLQVPEGSIYGLVGPNGAGKSTLLSILAGLRKPDSGTVSLEVDKARVAVATDVPEFEPWLTCREVIGTAQLLVGDGGASDEVERILEQVGLADVMDKRTSKLSRGMTQRLGLAATMVGSPRLVMLDEPSSALDPAGRVEILDLIVSMRQTATVIFSSHILADVQRICDHVGILREGRLIYQGLMSDLLERYLRPAWIVRVRGTGRVIEVLREEPWVTSVRPEGAGRIRVEGLSLDHGERNLVAALARAGAVVRSIEPAEADLESAFLHLTDGATQ